MFSGSGKVLETTGSGIDGKEKEEREEATLPLKKKKLLTFT